MTVRGLLDTSVVIDLPTLVAHDARTSRRRMADLMIAAAAAAHRLPLLTRNAQDVEHLEGLVEVRLV